jgi:GMP synthase (glutamine-hydrolysing)
MAIVIFEHHPDETSAELGAALLRHNHRLRVVRLHAGDVVPVDLDDVDGVVSMGGPMNVEEVGQYAWMPPELAYLKAAHERAIPLVGVCLGAQLIAAALGGEIKAMAAPEIGWHNVKLAFPGTVDPIMQGIAWDTMQFHVHGQEVVKLPPDGVPLAGSKACKTQAFKVGLTTYAFQYHFEWNQGQLQHILEGDGWLKQHADVAAIRAGIEEHYPGYRRRGDRLCDNLVNLLMPIDKRATRRLATARA